MTIQENAEFIQGFENDYVDAVEVLENIYNKKFVQLVNCVVENDDYCHVVAAELKHAKAIAKQIESNVEASRLERLEIKKRELEEAEHAATLAALEQINNGNN